MNAPFVQRRADADAGTLAAVRVLPPEPRFSSIEEEQRGEVIQRCYWPLLDLRKSSGRSVSELTGFHAGRIAAAIPNGSAVCGR